MVAAKGRGEAAWGQWWMKMRAGNGGEEKK